MDTEMFADFIYAEATNSDRSPAARRDTVLAMIDTFVRETAAAEYHRGRADGAIEVCRALGGFDNTVNELAVAMQKDADG
jgi:hypothetical protein